MELKYLGTTPYHNTYCTLAPGHNTVGMLELSDAVKTAMLANHSTWFAEYTTDDIAADVADALVHTTLLAKAVADASAEIATDALVAD